MRNVPVTTETVQLMQCRNGHRFPLILQDGGYALLYERALQRLALSQLRDAVLDAYTSLDMCMATLLLRNLYEARKGASSPAELRSEFSYVLKSAERTWGAALVVASKATGKAPPRIDTKLQNIRNEAAHGGTYPSEKDAEWACLEVPRLVWALGEKPRHHSQNPYFHALVNERLAALPTEGLGGTVTWSLMTVLGSIGTQDDPVVAKVRLDDYRDGEVTVALT